MTDKINGVDFENALKLAKKFLPKVSRSKVAIPAPGMGEGSWVGAPSAIESDGHIYLAYRSRRPIGSGRGQGVVIAKSKDGFTFETINMIPKEAMDAASLERPTLVKVDDKTWRLYLSCATMGTKHWRVEMIEASRPEDFDPVNRRMILPGSKKWAVKDTVIQKNNGKWDMWATFHPLDIKYEEDRMHTRYANSTDGINWKWSAGAALTPRQGKWDARGARVAAVYQTKGMVIAFYDGRASAAEDKVERTGIAVGIRPDKLVGIGENVFAESPYHRTLRYMDITNLKNGNFRTYYEIATDDQSHELRTELIKLK
ncbi:MAG TPA: hypothetical protein VLG47_05225 [Candidatus Saccharimonadales bacterium]|nr:hypothetical protein [Candidatus Saccharimonadales bacterium]